MKKPKETSLNINSMADFIKFLGTAGARVVLSKQLRASGGIWISLDDTNLYLDPGPGALVHCFKSRPKLDPSKIDAILLSHKHLDHSGDINVLIEAMTEGTFKKRGIVFTPKEALDDGVILKYVRQYPQKIEILKSKKTYKIKNISFSCPIKHTHHGTETYGFRIQGKKHTISYIADTKFSPELIKSYKADIVIMNVMRPDEGKKPLDHLSVLDVKKLIKGIKPKTAILTHFGMRMIMAKPWEIAEKLSEELKTKVIAASDGMMLELKS